MTEPKWQVDENSTLRLRESALGQESMGALGQAFVWRKGDLGVIITRDDLTTGQREEPDVRWHLSVSHRSRLPTWDEMVDTAHHIRPGVVFVVGVPPRSWWLNVHPNVLHLWEVHDVHLTRLWQSERQAHTPTGGRRVR